MEIKKDSLLAGIAYQHVFSQYGFLRTDPKELQIVHTNLCKFFWRCVLAVLFAWPITLVILVILTAFVIAGAVLAPLVGYHITFKDEHEFFREIKFLENYGPPIAWFAFLVLLGWIYHSLHFTWMTAREFHHSRQLDIDGNDFFPLLTTAALIAGLIGTSIVFSVRAIKKHIKRYRERHSTKREEKLGPTVYDLCKAYPKARKEKMCPLVTIR